MEKVKIKLSDIEFKEIDFNGQKIQIKNNIALEEYEKILNDIKNVIMYGEIEDKWYAIQLRMYKDILEYCSNVDVDSLAPDDFGKKEISTLIIDNIDNYYIVRDMINSEYKKIIMGECFGILAKKVPSGKSMEKSLNAMKDMVNNMEPEKLKMLLGATIWNKSPALGKALDSVPQDTSADKEE